MSEAHEKTRIRQLEDAAAHWEHKYANARQYNRNLEERCQKLEAALQSEIDIIEHHDRGSTHYAGCELDHRRCAALKRMRTALGSQTETKGDANG